MLLDTLKKFAFEKMNVQILKDNDTDCIIIENSNIETCNTPDGNATKITLIFTKINLDGEIVSSKIFETFKMHAYKKDNIRWENTDKSSQEYSDKLPSKYSETIQKSMEVCYCDIPKLSKDEAISIDKYGKIDRIHCEV